MKCLSRSRNLVATVLVLLLVASAPAALALPAGPGGGGGATWDVQALFHWMQDLLGGFFGGGGGEDEGPSVSTGKLRGEPDVNGHDLKGASTVEMTKETPTLGDDSLER